MPASVNISLTLSAASSLLFSLSLLLCTLIMSRLVIVSRRTTSRLYKPEIFRGCIVDGDFSRKFFFGDVYRNSRVYGVFRPVYRALWWGIPGKLIRMMILVDYLILLNFALIHYLSRAHDPKLGVMKRNVWLLLAGYGNRDWSVFSPLHPRSLKIQRDSFVRAVLF